MAESIHISPFQLTQRFFMTLRDENKRKVKAFCDIDPKKIGTNFVAPYSNIKVYSLVMTTLM